ncbi:MAG: polyribonucleotide nucleotidyltransferase [Bacteroidetes bacterium]|nr:polyribonucleotide nucleotidyltransferase [Bacteroidota bacterium]
MSQKVSTSIDLGDGRAISIETGQLAKQADGSALIRMGDAMLLATVVSSNEIKESQDFFPLTVEYQEKYAGAGRIPGGFFKREGRAGNHEILTMRMVDRVLRPLFPSDYFAETQVIISMISADKNVMTDALAGLAASTALMLSDIPFSGPISETRVALIDGKHVINPSREQMEMATLEIMVGATKENVMMVEGEMKEVSETELIDAIAAGHEAIKKQCDAQMELKKLAGIGDEVREYEAKEGDEEMQKKLDTAVRDKVYEVAKSALPKAERSAAFKKIKDDYIESLPEDPEEELDTKLLGEYYHDIEKEVIRKMILEDRIRLDGRKMDEVRELSIEVDYLPSAHGSALFTRGETQSLSTTTLGTKLDRQIIDTALESGYSKFLLHYNFPPFSTGEAKMLRGVSRREVGHGNLALRSLKQVLPPEEENFYTIRVVSDILESNGSSSMATVCAGSLSLMDAGIKITGNVAGIAMGLISDSETGKNAILTDILGDEDHLGDMDFKVTGTSKGICACQMDIKIDGLSNELLADALNQAKTARLFILDAMNKVMSEPRAELKPNTPRVEKVIIPKEFIGTIIGPGGKEIQELQKETDTIIFIEEIDEKGEVTITGKTSESVEKVLKRISGLTAVPEINEVYEGTIKSIMPYGAFVEIMPGKEGLLHISEISWKRLESMDGLFNVGDLVKVKLLDIDSRNGKFKLSRKVLLEKNGE